jgi:hypothetical protein
MWEKISGGPIFPPALPVGFFLQLTFQRLRALKRLLAWVPPKLVLNIKNMSEIFYLRTLLALRFGAKVEPFANYKNISDDLSCTIRGISGPFPRAQNHRSPLVFPALDFRHFVQIDYR